MLNSKFIVLIVCFAIFSSDCRQTKLFKDIEVRGRLINYFTKEPISDEKIVLRSNDVHSASSYALASIELASPITNSDGSFILKSKASKKNKYYLQIGDSLHFNDAVYDTSFTAEPGTNLNLGTLNSGVHDIFYKIRFTSVSGSCLWYAFQNPNPIRIRSGADTTIKFNSRMAYINIKSNLIHWIVNIGDCNDPINVNSSAFSFPLNYKDTSFFQKQF